MAPFFFRSSDFQAFFLRLWCFWQSFSLAEEKQREETPSLVKRALLAELSKDENLLARRAREEAKISFCEKMFAKRNQSKKKKTRVTQTSLSLFHKPTKKQNGPAVQPQRPPQGLRRPLRGPGPPLEARRRLQRPGRRTRRRSGRARRAAGRRRRRRRQHRRQRGLLFERRRRRAAAVPLRPAADHVARSAAVLRLTGRRRGWGCRRRGRGEPSDAGEVFEAIIVVVDGFPFFFPFDGGRAASFDASLLLSRASFALPFVSEPFYASSARFPCRKRKESARPREGGEENNENDDDG
jgi:hypothetical protein